MTAADWSAIDPDTLQLQVAEDRRQLTSIIMIAAVSICPPVVRQALASSFANIDAEGYPPARMAREEPAALRDLPRQLAYYRRYADSRYNMCTENANIVEVLAQRRMAALFANDQVTADDIFVNVQPPSGAIANLAVFDALLEPGDAIVSMALPDGGHLTHGSEFHRSAKYYAITPYGVDPQTGRLDYAALAELMRKVQPRLFIAGASSYPWAIDWARLRAIRDEFSPDTYLMADIAHPAGLVAAGLFPNPLGHADVTTLVTYKTLCGPRGAAIMTTDEQLAQRINRAVFPRLLGAPIFQSILAMAVALKLAEEDDFRALQRRIVANARALAGALERHGVPVAYGGTDTHLVVVDLNRLAPRSPHPLKGEVAARILEHGRILCNKNTIPGDTSAAGASGLRFGTTWVSQLGMTPEHMEQLAGLIGRVLHAIEPFAYAGLRLDPATGKTSARQIPRGKLPYAVLRETQAVAMELLRGVQAAPTQPAAEPTQSVPTVEDTPALELLLISGERAVPFLQATCTADVFALPFEAPCETRLFDERGDLLGEGRLVRLPPDHLQQDRFLLALPPQQAAVVRPWLQALSDGYVLFGHPDRLAKVDGPVVIETLPPNAALPVAAGPADDTADRRKPFRVGRPAQVVAEPRPEYLFEPDAPAHEPQRSPLHELHRARGARMTTFAGWELPVWYTRIWDEHRAVRQTAALFDVSHMGILEITGSDAAWFLDAVTTNYVPALRVGQGSYSFILDPAGAVIDDCYLYRLALQRYLLVVNAANTARARAWLQAVAARRWAVDAGQPAIDVLPTATIRDLKAPAAGADRRVDLALQGPNALRILQALAEAPPVQRRLAALRRNAVIEQRVAGFDLIIARTGYTGEKIGFELYVHPEQAPDLWTRLLEIGACYGLLPAGLGARDAARIEAGFPLYGHELAGPHDISPIGAGYGAFVKFHKLFFVGRRALLDREAGRSREVVRFEAPRKGSRGIRAGNPVIGAQGVCIGFVTSSAVLHDRQIGLAYIDSDHAAEGAGVEIRAHDEASRRSADAPTAIAATILSRW